MGWDYVILGNTVSAVSLAILLKRMGFKNLLISPDRRLGDISLQPFKANHLGLLGVDAEKHSEATYSHLTIHDRDMDYRLENPIYVCRTGEVLEEAAAVNELEMQLGAHSPPVDEQVVDCRVPRDGPLKSRVYAVGPRGPKYVGRIVLRTVARWGLEITLTLDTGSTLAIHYGIPSDQPTHIFLMQEYSLTDPASLTTMTLNNPPTISGLGLASPLGSPTADILISIHLAETTKNPSGRQDISNLVAACVDFVGQAVYSSTQDADGLLRLIYALDKA